MALLQTIRSNPTNRKDREEEIIREKITIIVIVTKMLKINSKINFLLFLFMACFSIVSCDENRVFDEYQSLEKQVWNKENELQFTFTLKDTVQSHDLFLNIRNNKEYAYSNLFVITSMRFPDGNVIIDTLEYDMTDSYGRFLGKGSSDVTENKLFYKENITFPASGTYTFKVRQAMRKNEEVAGIQELEGVTHVGFRIEKNKK